MVNIKSLVNDFFAFTGYLFQNIYSDKNLNVEIGFLKFELMLACGSSKIKGEICGRIYYKLSCKIDIFNNCIFIFYL
jgi:hypothetical protein